MAMSTSTGMGGAVAGRMVGGLVGWMLVKAVASKYYCPSHGEIGTDRLPAEHRSVVTTRRLLMGGGAAAILFLVFGCIFFGAFARSF
jgi:hypothetical protein